MFALQGDAELYASDWQVRGIESVDKHSGRGRRSLLRRPLDGIMDILYVSRDRQTGTIHGGNFRPDVQTAGL